MAVGSRSRLRAISSRQALASLSTRTGRLRSRSKEAKQSGTDGGGVAGGGVEIVTVVFALTCWPRSSTALQVTTMGPGGTPAVDRVTVEVTPEICPAEAE